MTERSILATRPERGQRAAERVADRLARLQAAAIALSEATTREAVATCVVQHARAAMGARHVLLARLDEGDDSLAIVRTTGFAPGALDEWRHFSIHARIPLAEVARTRTALFLESTDRALARYPDMASMLALTKMRSCAVVPLEANGVLVGVLCVCFVSARPFVPEDRSFLAIFARECATAFERVRCLDDEHHARARAETAARAAEFLSRASASLTQTLEVESMLARIARIAVPFLADTCAIDLPNEHGQIVRAATANADPQRERLLTEISREHPIDPRGMHPVARAMRDGRPDLVSVMTPEARVSFVYGREIDTSHIEPFTSYMIVPLIARSRTLGAILFASERADRRYRGADLALAVEIASRTALAVENARLYEEARRAVRIRDELLAIVSHDLRNPLCVVQATLKMMKRAVPQEEPYARFLHHADAIQRASERMNRLIADLLDFASLQAGRLSIESQDIDSSSLVDEAAAAMRPIAAQHGIAVNTELLDEPLTVPCDRARILQVFGNLLGNAVKFTSDGGTISLGVCRRSALDGSGTAYFWVRDSGPGIAPEHVARVFDRYWQAKETARLGTGLGLAIAKGIVEAHGGAIGVETRPGSGACFFFTLPMPRAATPR